MKMKELKQFIKDYFICYANWRLKVAIVFSLCLLISVIAFGQTKQSLYSLNYEQPESWITLTLFCGQFYFFVSYTVNFINRYELHNNKK